MRTLVSASLISLALVASLAQPPSATAADRWKLLGKTRVSDRVERDVVTVTRARGGLDSIRLEVEGRAVQFRAVTLHFANGDRQEVELRDRIPAGGQSRVIDVEGAERIIRSLELVYDAQSLGGRATVKIYGHG